jgi:hypothetical protein
MERYSIFTEKSTGVNPFVHPPHTPWLVGLVFLALPRFLIAFTLAVLLFPLEYVACCLDAVAAPSLGGLLRKHALSYLARALLFFLGFHGGGVTRIAARKETLLLRPPPRPASSALPPSGELLLVNKTSWLDSLVLLATKGSACGALSDTGVLTRVSLFSAVCSGGGFLGGNSSSSAPTSGDGVKSITGTTIACHPEGAPTNGKAVLKCSPGLGLLGEAIAAAAVPPSAPKPTILTIGIHYDTGEGNFTPCFLGTCSPWYHLLCLLSQPASKVSVFSLPPTFDPQPVDFSTIVSPGGNSVQPTSVASAWPLAVGGAWEQLLRGFGVRAVGLDASAYARYLAMVKGGKNDKAM